jgi:hypothetical protein
MRTQWTCYALAGGSFSHGRVIEKEPKKTSERVHRVHCGAYVYQQLCICGGPRALGKGRGGDPGIKARAGESKSLHPAARNGAVPSQFQKPTVTL